MFVVQVRHLQQRLARFREFSWLCIQRVNGSGESERGKSSSTQYRALPLR